MNLFKENPVLTFLLLVLLALKFVVSPVIEWQEKESWQLSLQEKKLKKSMSAIEQKTMSESQLAQEKELNSQLLSLFFEAGNEAAFKVQNQALIERMLRASGLQVVNIGWANSAVIPGTGMIKHRLDLRATGKAAQVPLFHMTLTEFEKWIQLESFNITLNSDEEALGSTIAQFSLTFVQLAEDDTDE